LGVHWLSDVIAGLLLGIILLTAYRSIEQKIISRILTVPSTINFFILLISTLALSLIFQFKDAVTIMGLLMGMGAGIIVENDWIKFDKSRNIIKIFAVIIIGIVGTIVLWFGLGKLFPDLLVFRYVRYAIVGFWGTAGAPYSFIVLNLYIKQDDDLDK
jgi:hypothetical protein